MYYNEKNISSYNVVDEIDILDFKIINFALKNKKPLLGICRGLQSINVFFGGTLNQHTTNHQRNNHFIYINKHYYLVNSYHHQTIKDLGNLLNVIALSLDGNVEIIKYQQILGVQFHPELMDNKKLNQMIQELILT